MYEVPCYRIDVEKNGKVINRLYACSSLETIRKAMEGNLKSSGVVKVYPKGGRKTILEFRG